MRTDRPDVLRNPMGVSHKDSLKKPDRNFDSPERFGDKSDDTVVDAGSTKDVAVENYKRGKLKLHFHIRIRGFGEYCIVLKGLLDRGIRNQDIAPALKGSSSRDRLRHGDQLVFIFRVQFLKQPENTVIRIRSLVRLQVANYC